MPDWHRRWRLCVVAFCLCAGAVRAEDGRGPERDDPWARIRAREVTEGVRTPAQSAELLRIAHAEAVRWGIRNPGRADAPARVPGNSWVNLGPTSADFTFNGVTLAKVDSGRPRTILVDPNDANIVYLATSGGGVWKTFDALAPIGPTAGPHWTPITEAIGSLSIGSLAMNPQNSSSLLLGLGDAFDVKTPGFFHSDDAGATWQGPVTLAGDYQGFGPAIATSVHDLQFDPGGAVVLAATDAGLFRSTQGGTGDGASWSLIDLVPGHTPFQCWSLAFLGGQTWLVTCEDLTAQSFTSDGFLFKSTDGGQTWSDITANLGAAKTDIERMTLAACAADRGSPATARVYLLAENGDASDQKDVFKSSDGGATFTALGMTPGGKAPSNPNDDQTDLDVMHFQAFYNHMIIVDPADHDHVFVGGNLSMVRSLDGGTNWDVMTHWLPTVLNPPLPEAMYVHADWHAAAFATSGGKTFFYAGTDGGLFRSEDLLTASAGAAIWEDKLNRGIVSHLLYSVSSGNERAGTAACKVPAGSDELLFGGLQDNGTRLRVPGEPTVFNQVKGGDGFGVGVGCATGTGDSVGSLLLSTYVKQVNRSTDSGVNFNLATNGFPTANTLDGFYDFHMKVATDLTDPKGQTFLVPLTLVRSAYPDCPTGVSPCYESNVFLTSNGAASWVKKPAAGGVHRAPGAAAPPDRDNFPNPMTNVATDPKNAGHYAAITTSRAYASTDSGANWSESTNVLVGTEFLVLQTVAFDSSDSTGNTVWVGSKFPTLSGGTAIPDATGRLYKCTTLISAHCSDWTSKVGSGAGALPNVPINVIKQDPGDAQTFYVGTEIGLYRSTDGGSSWARYGKGLPLVSVTDLAIAANGSSIRAATFGRGFWEIHPQAGGSITGVYGNGDFNRDQLIDGFDLVAQAADLLLTNASDNYDATGNLTGATNSIDDADLDALLAKYGGRP